MSRRSRRARHRRRRDAATPRVAGAETVSEPAPYELRRRRVEEHLAPAVTPERPPLDGVTGRLTELLMARDRARAAVDEEVHRLVEAGVNWPTIGRALGVSRQAARQRYGGS